MPKQLFITNARISFANGLFEASSLEPNQTPKFGADFILQPDSKVFEIDAQGNRKPTTLKQAELEVATETWKANGAKMLASLEPSKRAVRDGSLRVNKNGDVYDGYEGNTYVTAKSATRPTVIDADKTPLSQSDGRIYSGCYVNVRLDLYGNAVPAKKGVFAGLKGVQFARDGDAFGGGAPARADEFDDVSEGADAADIA
jgi:hypothetical protein